MDTEKFTIWNSSQTYIALGMLLQTAAELKIDSTPMEGFDVNSFNEVLGLSEKGLTASIICAIGYRSQEDATQHNAKVRKSEADLFQLV
jgi:nitroreductase